MVSGKNRIRIRCGRNSKRIVWILSGTDQQKDLAGRRTGKDIPDHRRSDHGVMDIMWNLFTAPDKEWRRKAEQALREQSVANGNTEAQAEQKQYIRRDDEDKELLSSSCDDAVWIDFLFSGVAGITDISDRTWNPISDCSQRCYDRFYRKCRNKTGASDIVR